MKRIVLALAFIGLAHAASANNSVVEDAIKSRSDLSRFYDALVATGVLNELSPNTSYVILAPTNEAFAEIDTRKYPCFVEPACRDELADVLRNHFVPGFYEMDRQSSLFSIDKRQLIVGKPHRGSLSVEGNQVVSESQLAGSMLYKIDGVIVNDNELNLFRSDYATPVVERRMAPAR